MNIGNDTSHRTSQYENPMLRTGMQLMGHDSGGNTQSTQEGLAGMMGMTPDQLRQILEQLQTQANVGRVSSPYRNVYMDNDGGPY